MNTGYHLSVSKALSDNFFGKDAAVFVGPSAPHLPELNGLE